MLWYSKVAESLHTMHIHHLNIYAELFTWVLEKKVSEEQAMRCAKREAGRPWEANEPELHKLGMYYRKG